jgi:phosphopantothenate--cysteine ligase
MRILITGGGTKAPIDPVRSITNSSTGKLGADIAKAALIANAEVTYLVSSDGKSPFRKTFDFYKSNQLDHYMLELRMLAELYAQYQSCYTEHRYHTYEEYSSLIEKIIINEQPDVVILAAAVSDYTPDHYSTEKIGSNESLHLKMKPAPKLISFIKKWLPNTFLVGFKLLINASDAELVDAAMHSFTLNKADLIIANNLSSLQRGAHEILLIERDGAFKKVSQHLADEIVARIMRRST